MYFSNLLIFPIGTPHLTPRIQFTLLLHTFVFISFQLNASHNEVLRMSPVLKLKNLVKLDLSHNNILNIEGLKDLIRLQYLNLSSNHIKVSFSS